MRSGSEDIGHRPLRTVSKKFFVRESLCVLAKECFVDFQNFAMQVSKGRSMLVQSQ